MKEIPLTQGKVALVDDRDCDELNKYNWCAYKCKNAWYAYRHAGVVDGKRRHIKMHQQLLGRKKGLVIDHIDGDGLNNQRNNLRHVTIRQNAQNIHTKKTSTLPGVCMDRQKQKWVTQIVVNGKQKHLGLFEDETAAHARYMDACRILEQEGIDFLLSWIKKTSKSALQTSQYRGVCWKKANKKWQAQIGIGKKKYHLGLFDTEEDACSAYLNALSLLKKEGPEVFESNIKPQSSKYKGVSYHKASQKWHASKTYNRKQIYLGLFDTEEGAHHAYLCATNH